MAGKRRFGFTAADNMMNANVKPEETKSEEIINEIPETETIPSTKTSKVQSLLGELDEPFNTAFNFKFVNRNKMVFHAKNDYPMESIEELADLILDVGLIHNIEVVYNLEKDEYMIDSGERRTRAIDCLIEKYKDFEDKEDERYQKYLKNIKPFEQGYPCNVKIQTDNETLDEINSEIRLIVANEEVREKDPIRTRKHITRLNELFSKRNSLAKTKEERINVNKTIGQTLNISDRQVKNYKAIDKLIPELLAKFEEKQINLSDGANYAQLSEEDQRQILKLIENGDSKKEINALYEQLNRMKADMQLKEKEIKRLEEEKTKALQAVNDSNNRVKELRAEIEKEFEENNPNKELVAELETKLAKEAAHTKQQKKTFKNKLAEQETKISELETKLFEKEHMTLKDTNQIKAESRLEMAIQNLEKEIIGLESALESYSEYNEHLPNELQKILKHTINKLEIISNKKD